MAAALSVLSAGAIRRSVGRLVEAFERAKSVAIAVDFAPAPKVRARVLAGELVDVVIASSGALDALAKEAKIASATRTLVGRTRMAVMIRKGSEAPDLSSTAAFTSAMLGADAVLYNEGSSGAHAAAIVERLGLRERMGPKIQVAARGADLIEAVAAGPGRVFGLAQLTTIFDQVEKGVPVAFGGVFPGEIQNVTSYEAAVGAASRDAELAGALVRSFTSAEARKMLAAAGLD